MYKDLISYELAENISEEHLIKIAKQIINSWMSKQKGFIKWEIHKTKENSYTDIVYWESEKDAKEAEKNMVNIPDANEWYKCYKEGSISSKKLWKLF